MFIAHAAVMALTSGDNVSDPLQAFVSAVAPISAFAAYLTVLGAHLLRNYGSHPRLLPLSDEVAADLQWFPARLVTAMLIVSISEHFAATMELSQSASIAIDASMAILLALTLAHGLRRGTETHVALFRRMSGSHAAPASATLPLWLSIGIGVVWIVLIASALATLAGFVAFGSFIAKQTAWVLIVVSTAYLLMRAADDVLKSLLHSHPAEQTNAPIAASASARKQAAVLLSAAAHAAIVLFAALLLLAPYGGGPLDVFQHAYRVQEGLTIGKIQLRPEAVGRALLVLLVGIVAVKALRSWLQRLYLPTTRMDLGMRDSVTSLFGYTGYIVVIALVLSALGVGLQQIAWVASALAVGIGFGLQAIVQNFVSGLILLAERPVRVGDWVALGDIEGDIRRINVRATEIQRGDRSTVIVPNSEFITKAVRNVTFGSALGLVQIKLPLPLSVDVERVRDEIMQAFKSHADVLQNPAPGVMLDGIDGGNLIFNATAFVSSPRLSYGVRSAVLFDALARLKRADIPLVAPTTVVMAQ
jgi:small-conductance mechanosensitive channel